MKAFDLLDIYHLAEIVSLSRYPEGRKLVGFNRAEYLSNLMLFRETCESLGFVSTVRQIERIERIVRADTGPEIAGRGLWDEIKDEAVQMGIRFNEEVGAVHAYHLTEAQQGLYTEPTSEWQAALASFPSALNDIQETGRCLAVGRYTASVFHAMRVLEFGFAALGKEFDERTNRNTWHTVIKRIQDAIEAKSKAEGGRWPDQPFYSDAATQMRFFKDAWRNHVMHARVTFDDETAPVVVDHVRRFMNHLATKLME